MPKNRQAIPRAVSDAVLREFNHRCAKCGGDKPHLHHIDENPSNNDPLNLIPLCPNHHLTDQHDASNAIPQAKLRLFRRHKHRLILAPQFNSIFKRMTFLEDVKDDDDPYALEHKAVELADLVSHLPMGQFFSRQIGSALSFDREPWLVISGAPPDPKDAERTRREARAYIEKLRSSRRQIEEWIVELLDHQEWQIAVAASPGLPLRR